MPKYRRKVVSGQLRKELGRVLADLARQQACRIVRGSLHPDHVQMEISLPPKSAVSQVIGYSKGKSALWIARPDGGRTRHFVGEHCGTRGSYVSPVGADAEVGRAYIAQQERADKRRDQLSCEQEEPPGEAPDVRTTTRFERFTLSSHWFGQWFDD